MPHPTSALYKAYLNSELNSLVDKEKGMTLKETRHLCEQKTILRELQERFPFKETNFDLSLLKLQPDAEAEIENIFYDMAISIKDSELCVANNGLCLLIASALSAKRWLSFITAP